MADQIAAKINTASTAGTIVDAQQLKDMFNNVNGNFVDSALKLNSSGLKLSGYCAPAAAQDILNYFDSVGTESQSTSPAGNGIPGRAASSVSASKKYLFSANGVFYSQVVWKSFNGLCAYAITNIYLKDSVSQFCQQHDRSRRQRNRYGTLLGSCLRLLWRTGGLPHQQDRSPLCSQLFQSGRRRSG